MKYLLLVIFLSGNFCLLSQPDFELINRIDLAFEIKDVAVNGNGEVLVLSQDDEIYLIKADATIQNISALFPLSSGSVFTTVQGTRSPKFYVGTSKDYLFEYRNDTPKQIGIESGLEGDSITSIYEWEYSSENRLFVGTNKELYQSYDFGLSFDKIDFNSSLPEEYSCHVYEGNDAYIIFESEGPSTSRCNASDEDTKVTIFGFSSRFETIFSYATIPGNIQSRMAAEVFNRPNFYMATDQGIYSRSWECQRTYQKSDDLIVNAFAEAKVFPWQVFRSGDQASYTLAGTDNGLYISNVPGAANFSLISGSSDLKIIDALFNECTALAYAVETNSITVFEAQVDYSMEQVDLTNDISMTGELTICNGDSLMLESTAIGNHYNRQWLRNGEEIDLEVGKYLTVKDSGEYSVRYEHCLFDQSQITAILNVKFYTRDSIELSGDPEFTLGSIANFRIVVDPNDSLYFINEVLIDDSRFSINSDTTVQVKVLTKDNCSFEQRFEFSALVLSNELEKEVRVYPNPFDHSFFVDGLKQGQASVRLVDLSGKVLNISMMEVEPNGVEFAVPELQSGVYFLVIENRNEIIKRKILKVASTLR